MIDTDGVSVSDGCGLDDDQLIINTHFFTDFYPDCSEPRVLHQPVFIMSRGPSSLLPIFLAVLGCFKEHHSLTRRYQSQRYIFAKKTPMSAVSTNVGDVSGKNLNSIHLSKETS